jgi:hypothetical protein
MSIRINDAPIEASYVEYAVLWDDGTVTEFEMTEAYKLVNSGFGTRVLARRVYETAWAQVAP